MEAGRVVASISVIVPVYNVEPYLRRCIDSILLQTFKGFELILVDDGSSDNCGSICDDYARQDSRVRVIHQDNQGLSAARNAGLDWMFANSNCEYVAFVDSDDMVAVDYLESLLYACTKCSSSVSVCHYIEIRDSPVPLSSKNAHGLPVKEYFVEEFWCDDWGRANSAWNKLYRRELWQNIRFPVGRIHEDAFVTYRLIFGQKYIPVVELGLYYYFCRSDSIMHSRWSPSRFDEFDAIEEQLRFFRDNKFHSAYKNVFKALIYLFASTFKQLSSSRHVYRSYKDKVRVRLLKTLSEFHLEGGFSNAEKYAISTVLHPHMHWFLWRLFRVQQIVASIGKVR